MISKNSLHPALVDPLLDVMNFLNEIALRFPEAISFAPGRPYEGNFKYEQITSCIQTYITHLERDRGFTSEQVNTTLFQYGRTNGHIQDLIATMLKKDEGIDIAPEALVVTVGCQESMFLVLRALFTGTDDVLLVNSPCYIGITGVAKLLGIEFVPTEESGEGISLDAVVREIRRVREAGKRPKALYVIPDFSNPSGSSLPLQARLQLLGIAKREEILILEDNPYGFFSNQETRKPTIKSLDKSGHVIYMGSFSKVAFPGLRVGYTIADQVVVDDAGQETLLAYELSKIKSMISVNTSPICQAIIGGMLIENDCSLLDANRENIRFYKNNMDLALRSLERHFPSQDASFGVTWNVPEGGFFLVVDLPFRAENEILELSAKDYKVIWTPMSYFYTHGGGERQIRLSVSYITPEQVEEGISRLAHMIKDQLQGRAVRGN